MSKVKQKAIKTGISAVTAGSLFFFLEKIADYYINIIASDNNVTLKKIIFFLIFLSAAGVIVSGLQNVRDVFYIVRRRFRNETRVEELQRRIGELREEIIDSSKKFRMSKNAFNSKADSASQDVCELSPYEDNFNRSKENAAIKILGLKTIYQDNISAFERLARKACEDIDAAERVFKEADNWADEDVDAVLGEE